MTRRIALAVLVATMPPTNSRPREVPAVASVQLSKTTLAGGGSLLITVTLTQAAPLGGSSVNLAYSNASVLSSPPKGIAIASGQQSGSVALATVPTASPVAVVVTGSLGASSANATVTVRPPQLQQATMAGVVQGGTVTDLVVTLDGPAPQGGSLVDLDFSPAILRFLPTTFTVTLPGSGCSLDEAVVLTCTQTFTSVDSANILTVAGGTTVKTIKVLVPATRDDRAVTGTASVGTSKSLGLTIRRPQPGNPAFVTSCDMSATSLTSVAGPAHLHLRVHTNDRVAKSGAYVTVGGRSPVPPPVNLELSQVSGGIHYACIPVPLPAVTQPAAHTLVVTGGATQAASITNLPLSVTSVALSSDSVSSGSTVTATITMSAPTGADATVQVSSSNTTGAIVTPGVVVAQGLRTATMSFVARFPLTSALPVVRVVISATYQGSTRADTLAVSR